MARAARAGATVAPRPVRRPRPRSVPPRALPRAVRARGEGVLDALLRGRACIGLVALLLVGIVFFNVDLLRLNRSIAVTSEQAAAVARENSRLRLELARLGSSERVQRAAQERGLVLPAPGDVRFRRPGRDDGRRAAANLRAGGEQRPAAPTPAATAPGTEVSPATGNAPAAQTPPATTSPTAPAAAASPTAPPAAAPQPAATPRPAAPARGPG